MHGGSLNNVEEFFDPAVHVSFSGVSVHAEDMWCGILIFCEVPDSFVGAEGAAELAFLVILFALFDWVGLELGLSRVHEFAVALHFEEAVDLALNLGCCEAHCLETLQEDVVVDVYYDGFVNTEEGIGT